MKTDNKIRKRKVSSTASKSNNIRKIDNKKIENNQSRSTRSTKSRTTQDKPTQSRTSRRKKKVRVNKKRLFGVVISFILTITILMSLLVGVKVYDIIKEQPVLTREIIQENYLTDNVVSSDQMPEEIKHAIVAIEDERFYEHKGVDIKSLVRSVLNNLLTDTTQGGSTIEMQISKNLLTSLDQNYERKIIDMYNALQMNSIMSKDEILNIYLNNIYLGKSSYGVFEGAQAYFGKKLSELNLAECAMLIGITNNPQKYQEFSEAKRRQEIILLKMNELGYITEKEYYSAKGYEIAFKSEID